MAEQNIKTMTPSERMELLKELGVEFATDYEYVGEVGKDRHRVERPDRLTSVKLPFTPDEWCRIAMRDGDLYVGPCCGNTGAIQDEINAAFRDSGWIDNESLWWVGVNARGHEGFETFQEMDDERFTKLVANWKRLEKDGLPEGSRSDPWAKMGVIYNAVEPLLRPKNYELPNDRDKDPIRVLYATFSYLTWEGMFTQRDDDVMKTQHDANRLLTKARALGPTRQLLAALEAEDFVLEGYALVHPETKEVLTNRAGVCFYKDETEALYWINAAKRVNDEEDAKAEGRPDHKVRVPEIVPATVSIAKGLELVTR